MQNAETSTESASTRQRKPAANLRETAGEPDALKGASPVRTGGRRKSDLNHRHLRPLMSGFTTGRL